MRRLVVMMGVLAGVMGVSSVWAKSATDLNGDGMFSKDEVLQVRQKQLDKKFAKMDQNQDGQITADELKSKKRGVGIAKKADVNKDGVITQAEARAHLSENVDRYMQKKDANKDGLLDPNERKRAKKAGDSAAKKPKKLKAPA